MSVLAHPGWLRRRFRRYLLYLSAGAAFQILWAALVFAFIRHHPLAVSLWLEEGDSWTFSSVVVVYSMVSLTQAFYILLTVLMAFFLNSRVWFYTGLVFSIMPGLLPSLVQIPLALFLWLEIRRQEWDHFFSRFDDVRRMNGLTEQRRKRL